MKILILSFYFKPDLCAGSFRCTALVEALLATSSEVEIEVITTLPNRYASFSPEAKEVEKQDRLLIYRTQLSKHQSGMIDQSIAFFGYAKNVISITKNHEYDLIIGTSSRLMTAALSGYLAKRKAISLYLDIRDIFVDTIKDVLPKKLALVLKPAFSFLEKISFRQADTVNLVSRGFSDYFHHRYPNKNYSYFTNGVDEEFINSISACSSHSPNKTNNVIKVLYAGNIGEGQGLHTIIPELASKLGKGYEFKIIGDGGKRKLLEEKLKEKNLKNVIFKLSIPRQELIKEYQLADVLFLHLNTYSAFEKVLPSKIFEYAAMGKPILAGVSGYAAQFLNSEVSNVGVFTPGNAEKAIKVLANLKLNNSCRADFINKYRRKTVMGKMAEDVLRLLEIKERQG